MQTLVRRAHAIDERPHNNPTKTKRPKNGSINSSQKFCFDSIMPLSRVPAILNDIPTKHISKSTAVRQYSKLS